MRGKRGRKTRREGTGMTRDEKVREEIHTAFRNLIDHHGSHIFKTSLLHMFICF